MSPGVVMAKEVGWMAELYAISAVVAGGTALMAFTTIFIATLVEHADYHPLLAWTLALLIGTTFGAAQGYLTFDGTLSSSVTSIVIGLLLLLFIVLQRLMSRSAS